MHAAVHFHTPHTQLNLLWAILARWRRFTQEILLKGLGVLKTTMMLTGRPDLSGIEDMTTWYSNTFTHLFLVKPHCPFSKSALDMDLLTLTCQVCLEQIGVGDTCWHSGSPPPLDGWASVEPDTSPETLWYSDSGREIKKGEIKDGPHLFGVGLCFVCFFINKQIRQRCGRWLNCRCSSELKGRSQGGWRDGWR